MQTFLQRSRLSDPDKSAAWKLFTWRFQCQIRQLHTQPDWVFSDYGVISSGNRAIDSEVMNTHMDILLTPMDMALFTGRGVDIIINNPADSVCIYELVSMHLADWVDALENNPHITQGPVAELRMFDDLATMMWRVARHYIKAEVGTSHIMQRLNKFYVNPLGKRNSGPRTTITIDEEHNSRTNDIVRLTTQNISNWKR